MAFVARHRSNASLFQRILRTESVLLQRSTPERSSVNPKSLPEGLRNYATAGSKEEKVKIDQNILGGLVVEFGQKVFDMSIRTRARQMEKFLRDPVNFESL